jgi:predicted DNA-binding ribbon-helix-helix protein
MQPMISAQLICQNVTLGGRRTSLRLAHFFWECLDEIAKLELCKRQELVNRIWEDYDHERRPGNFTNYLRLWVLAYYRRSVSVPSTARVGAAMPPALPDRADEQSVSDFAMA